MVDYKSVNNKLNNYQREFQLVYFMYFAHRENWK